MSGNPAPNPSGTPGHPWLPKVLRVGKGGFGANWEVEYLGQGRLRYAYSDGPLVDQAGTLVEPTRAQWEHFWRELSAMDVWEWAAEYLPEAQVLDSMCWSLEVAVAGQFLISKGENAYPGGRDFSSAKNSEFYLFLAALARLKGCRELLK